MRATALLVVACFLGQDPNQLPKDTVRNFTIRRTDPRHDPKTNRDVEEVTLILRGDEITPINADRKIFDVRGVKASYFTEPEKDRLSKEIEVTARRGRYDNDARTLKLEDHVRVVKKNDDETPPQADTVLLANSLLLRFNRMYECPECRRLQIQKLLKRPGRCVDHNVPLKEATITSVESDGSFEMMGPEGILSGEGLFTDDAINKEYHIAKNGFVELEGATAELTGDKKVTARTETKFSQIFSRGPLHVTGREHDRVVQGEGGMRIDRIDSSGTLTVLAEEMTIATHQAIDPVLGKPAPPEVRNVDARGKVILDGVLFADGTSFHTTSDTLVRKVEGDNEITDLRSTGESLVHVKTGASTIESRNVTIRRTKDALGGVSEFEDVARSDLVAGDQHFNLKCDKLTTTAEPDAEGKTNLRTLHAQGRVNLGGLMAGAASAPGDAGKADADLFEWDVATRRGWLEAKPFVRITQGPSTILAPKVVLESPKIIVLKGPKQVHLVQARDGKQEEYRATCEGDLVLDQDAQRLWMRDRCVIRTKDMLLKSDRVNATLSEGGATQGLESLLALGRVSALRKQDQTTLYGDRLAYRFADQDLKVYGGPLAVADRGRVVSTQEQIRIYEKMNPRTKVMTRYTELFGGAESVRMEIEERPADQPHPGKHK